MSHKVVCSASGLPISAGHAVVVFLLTESPHRDDGTLPIGIDANYFVRTPPMRGVYEDFCSFESNDKAMKSLWLQGFQQDLIEAGPNRETSDWAVRFGMSWDHTMSAIHDGAIMVQSDKGNKLWRGHRKIDNAAYLDGLRETKEDGHDQHYPTRARVEAELQKAFPGMEGLLVDEKSAGHIRVRLERDYSRDDAANQQSLLALKPPLDLLYGVVLVRDEDGLCLWVVPTANSEHEMGYCSAVRVERNNEHKCRVSIAMIRDDVYKILASLTPEREARGVKKSMEDVVEFFASDERTQESPLERECSMLIAGLFHVDTDDPWNGVSSMFGIKEHLLLLAQEGKLTPKIIKDMVVFWRVRQTLQNMHHLWRPISHAHEVTNTALLKEYFAKLAPKVGRR